MKKINLSSEKIGWFFYSFADSSYITVIVTVLFSLYFKEIIVGQAELGTALWGRAISISMLIVAFLAPIMGAVADYSHSRKLLLIICTYITIIFTALLFFLTPGQIGWAMLLLIIANSSFNMSNVFNNSFITEIAEQDEIGRISGLAWGIGYLGGLSALLIILPIINTNSHNYLNYRFSFLVVAIFFLIFSLPAFILLKGKRQQKREAKSYLMIAISRLIDTGRQIKKYHELLKFLGSYFLYNDGITVVISFAAIYGSSRFGMSAQEMIIYFIFAQPSSFLGAFVFGYFYDRFGAKCSINISLIIWIFVIFGAYLCPNKNLYYLVGICAGFVMGATQSNSRTLFAMLSPRNKATEFFGFFSVTGRLASIIGPIIYGEVARITNNQKNSILSVLVFFIFGIIFFQFVNIKKGIKSVNQ